MSYIVEQWAVSRAHPTFIITTYSGDHTDKLACSILAVPNDETLWSAKLQTYLRALNQFHARRKDTPDGVIMITSLTGFPSTLSVLPIPFGDVNRYLAGFFVNLNLKRLGCSGRVGLALAYPNSATIAKYYQLYRVSDKIPLYRSVIELVRLCQMALYVFGMLDTEYMDGLLCDLTEKAAVRWWTELGIDLFPSEPHDGILGPSTVSALVGALIGSRNRLHAIGMPIGKDVFDIDTTKKAVSHFQKSQRLHRSRKLDPKTTRMLRDLTEKIVVSEGLRLPKAVKATIAEISGRGDELLQQGATKRTRIGAVDVETTDINTLARLVSGDRARLVWQGRPLKLPIAPHHTLPSREEITSANTDKSNDVEGHKRNLVVSPRSILDARQNGSARARPSIELDVGRSGTVTRRETTKQMVQGVLDDGKTGISRLKGAVTSRKRTPVESDMPSNDGQNSASSTRDPNSSGTGGDIPSFQPTPNGDGPFSAETDPSSELHWKRPSRNDRSALTGASSREGSQTREASQRLRMVIDGPLTPGESGYRNSFDARPIESVPNSPIYHGVNLEELLPKPTSAGRDKPHPLRRTMSDTFVHVSNLSMDKESLYLRRRLSFSLAESSVHGPSMNTSMPARFGLEEQLEQRFIEQRFFESAMHRLQESIDRVGSKEAHWSAGQVDGVERLVEAAQKDEAQLKSTEQDPVAAMDRFSDASKAVMHDENDIIDERRRELETLVARLSTLR